MRKAGIIKNLILVGIALFLLGAIVFLGLFAFLSRDLPDPNSLTMREVAQSTKIYDRTGEHLLYEIAGDEKRTLVKLDEIPQYLRDATVTAEDRKFYEHGGIDILGIFRAIFSNVTSLDPTGQGASTITQQLVKNAILTTEKTYTRKIKEIILSFALEKRYTKDEILQLYLNEIPYGSTNYGVESASRAYFDKHVSDLTLAESATIAALPKAPSTFLNNPERLKARRDWILDSMVDEGYITQEEADEAKAQVTDVQISIANIKAPHFVLWVKELLEQKYGERMVEQGGLTVVTSLDYDKQIIAEEAVVANRDKNGEQYQFNNTGLVSIDPRNGHILAMVGSVDYFDDEIDGQVNTTLRPLQPGSSIKPIIYGAAFEKGYTPNTILWDTETDFATSTGNYHPRNYDLSEHGAVTIRKALQGSLNIPAVKTLALIGVDAGLDFAERMHYSTFGDRSNFGLAIVLGGAEVKLLDHTSAYGIYAADGVYHEPVAILKVTDSAGTVVEEWKESEGERVMDANIARIVTNVLSDDASRAYVFGTGGVLTLPGRQVAAKTGTTNDYNDAWTMGYTPQLVTGVWVGNTNGKEMNRAGGTLAAGPVWNEYMRRALAEEPALGFPTANIPITGKPILDGQIPSQTVTIDTASGKLATEQTPERFRETKTCGEFHDTLYFVDPSDPWGPAPEDPTKNPMYASWEAGVQAYLLKEAAKAVEEGRPPMEVCTIPTEADDVHVGSNQPSISIRSPKNDDGVGRSFTTELRASAPRGISRIEYRIDNTLVLIDYDEDGTTIVLPSWVSTGDHALTAYAYDDVDNSSSDEVSIRVNEGGATLNGVTITNPFNNQTIEKTADTYPVIVEASNAEDLESMTISIQSFSSGATVFFLENNAPGSFNSFEWPLPSAGDYTILVYALTASGDRVDAVPVTVSVTETPTNETDPSLILVPLPEVIPAPEPTE